jgi:hypothetical protein
VCCGLIVGVGCSWARGTKNDIVYFFVFGVVHSDRFEFFDAAALDSGSRRHSRHFGSVSVCLLHYISQKH